MRSIRIWRELQMSHDFQHAATKQPTREPASLIPAPRLRTRLRRVRGSVRRSSESEGGKRGRAERRCDAEHSTATSERRRRPVVNIRVVPVVLVDRRIGDRTVAAPVLQAHRRRLEDATWRPRDRAGIGHVGIDRVSIGRITIGRIRIVPLLGRCDSDTAGLQNSSECDLCFRQHGFS